MAEPDDDTKPLERQPSDVVEYWCAQFKAYDQEFDEWTTRCKKIVARYRAERKAKSNGDAVGGPRFNSLWSNVQTLQPAIYIKAPQPVVERRYRDKDPLARISSMTLERACEVQIEVGKMHPAMRKAVLDYLLVGRATLWERYEPTFGEAIDLGEGPDDDKPTSRLSASADGLAQSGSQPAMGGGEGADAGKLPNSGGDAQEAPRPVTYERTCTDYVPWDMFKHSPVDIWGNNWWVSKNEMLTRKQLRDRFKGRDKESGKLLADLVPLRDGGKDKSAENDREKKRNNPRALVVEVWNKRTREVLFIAPDYPNAPLEVTDDPLHLDTFWPCPEPLYATLTNDSLVPVPDYVEYQDQADELDNLTARIQALTDAIRVNGVYDASIPELKRILSEGVDNRMIAVRNWAELTSKGGLGKSMDFVPIKEVAEALLVLAEAFDRTQAKMDQINGLSDIVRGQSSGGTKTATEQRIKGQFASLRLEDRKKEIARFARDVIAIKAEIIAEQFSTEILAEMTGMIPFIEDELRAEAPPAPPNPMMGHNGGPPMNAAGLVSPQVGAPGAGGPPLPAGAQPPMPMNGGMNGAPIMMPGAPPPDPIPALAQKRFDEAVALLKSDKSRTFRIDIETDSTVEPDRQAAKEAVTEMATAVGGLLEKALPIGQAMPQLAPALGQTLLFVLRTFEAGREVESIWEQAIDKMTQAAKNPGPKPPSPEEIKAEAEKAKMAMEADQAQRQAALDQRQAEQDFQLDQMKAKLEIEREQMKLQLERERLQMEREKMGMQLQGEQQKAAIQGQAQERAAAIDERAAVRQDELAQAEHARSAEAGEREHQLGLEVMEAKAEQAQKPKPEARV